MQIVGAAAIAVLLVIAVVLTALLASKRISFTGRVGAALTTILASVALLSQTFFDAFGFLQDLRPNALESAAAQPTGGWSAGPSTPTPSGSANSSVVTAGPEGAGPELRKLDDPAPPTVDEPEAPSLESQRSPAVVSVPLSLLSSTGMWATVYVGPQAAIIDELAGLVDFASDPDNLPLCALTVVFGNVSGRSAVVYAVGLPHGLLAAEDQPPMAVYGPDRTVHQQIVVLPSSMAPGKRIIGQARWEQDGRSVITDPYTVTRLSDQAGSQRWTLGGRTISCG